MAATQFTSDNIGNVQRNDLDITTSGEAVIRKVVAGTNITLSSTGVDAGTGDVTINASASAPSDITVLTNATGNSSYPSGGYSFNALITDGYPVDGSLTGKKNGTLNIQRLQDFSSGSTYARYWINGSTAWSPWSIYLDAQDFTAKGQTHFGTGSSAAGVLTVGSDGQVLQADSSQTLGVKWATASGGPVTNTASTPSLNFPVSGAVLKTSPVAGDEEVDANGIHYYTHATSERGVIDTEQFCTLTSAYTLTSQTAAQKMFNSPTNGAVTLSAKTYFFECNFGLSSMSSSSGSFGFALGGTAVIASQGWTSVAVKATSFATPVSGLSGAYILFNQAANTTLVPANTSGFAMATIKGKVRITTGGTLIPMVSLGVAAAAIVSVDSVFRIWPTGSNSVQSVGNWS